MENLRLKFNPNNERSPLTDESGKDVFHLCTDEEYDAIYRRIVACVNSCEGIETEMLETIPLGFKKHATDIDRLKTALLKIIGGRNCKLRFPKDMAYSTCLEQQAHAIEHPDQYGDNFRKELIGGTHLCDICIARQALDKV